MTGRLSVSKQKANLFQFFFLCCVENWTNLADHYRHLSVFLSKEYI
jgi:hypothetical protein